MIGKSDLVILAVSATVLVGGIVRWQYNLAKLDNTTPPIATNTQGSLPPKITASPAVKTSIDDSRSADNRQLAPITPGNASGASSTPATGDNVIIPDDPDTASSQAAQTAAPDASSTESNSEPLYGTYVVQSGDYLGKIANTFGTTVATLQRINNLTDTVIDINQEILYPLPAN